MASCAPFFCTVSAAALLAKAMAESISKGVPVALEALLFATATAYAPTKVSPAAVVSTTLTFFAGIRLPDWLCSCLAAV